MRIKVFVVILLSMVVLAIGLNTRNIDNIIDRQNMHIVTQIEMLEKAMQSVVAVYYFDADFPASGFYIGNGRVITAGHVAEENIEKVVFEDGTECPVLKRIVHPDYDCGILIIDPLDKPTLKFDLTEVQRGEEIFILGNPLGFVFLSTKGVVCGRGNIDGFFGDALLIITDAASQGGNSGSVLIDADGEIRGVWVGGWISRCGAFLTGCGMSICVDDILNVLEQADLQSANSDRELSQIWGY